jgi:uncharacterized protein (TIGR00297 family)
MILNLLLGLGLGAAAAWLAYRPGAGGRRFVTIGGALGIIMVAVITFLAGGWSWGILPLIYFLTSNLWARFRSEQKRGLAHRYDVGSIQSTDQILARAGWCTLLALVSAYAPGAPALYVAYVGGWAASVADVWATEIGVLSAFLPGRPKTRLLISRRTVSPGTPGGISSLGLLAGLVGSWLFGLIGLLALAIRAWNDGLALARGIALLPLAALLGGIAGSLTDSLLGSTAQAVYHCETCDQLSETPIHSCGQPARQIRGWSWLTNDWINLVASIVGAAATTVIVSTFGLH